MISRRGKRHRASYSKGYLRLSLVALLLSVSHILFSSNTHDSPDLSNNIITLKTIESGDRDNNKGLTASPLDRVDPFKLWSQRDQLSLETIFGVLDLTNDNGTKNPCPKNIFYFPSIGETSSLEQLAAAIHRKLKTGDRKIRIGVIGDSVAADPVGFVPALESFLTMSPLLDFEVVVSNLAVGGTFPEFHYFCNTLSGDEDIVIVQTVYVHIADGKQHLMSALQKSGFGLLLVGWRSSWILDLKRDEVNIFVPADTLNIPLLNFNENRTSMRECLPSNANFSETEEALLYKDEIHPSRLGDILIATFIGRTIEQAVSQYLPKNHDVDTTALVALPEKNMVSFDTVCFGRLDCSEGEPESIGTNRCLNVTRAVGFTREKHESLHAGLTRKMWWQGLSPGDMIEIQLDVPCTDIALIYNKRTSNAGRVVITIDGHILDENHQDLSMGELPNGVLDAWFEGVSWLPPDRGLLTPIVIAYDLDPTPHTLGLEILNTTHSGDGAGIHKFDFTAVACIKGSSIPLFG